MDFAAGSYGAMKAALIHYAKGLSRQLVGKGIRVNCVSPATLLRRRDLADDREDHAGLVRIHAEGQSHRSVRDPAEVANGVVFISSPMASRISGTNLVIDGALTVAV